MDIGPHADCRLSEYMLDILKITGPLSRSQLEQFQYLADRQESRQNLAEVRRIRRELLFQNFREDKVKWQSPRKYDSYPDSDSDKILKATKTLETLLPKYFSRHMKDNETQTSPRNVDDCSEKVGKTEKKSTNVEILTSLMMNAASNVPEQSTGNVAHFFTSCLNELDRKQKQGMPYNSNSNSHRDNKMKNNIETNILESFNMRMASVFESVLHTLKNKDISGENRKPISVLDTKGTTPLNTNTLNQSGYDESITENYLDHDKQVKESIPAQSLSHASTFSYYVSESAIPINWAADATYYSHEDSVDDEYFREKLVVPKLDLSFLEDIQPIEMSVHDSDSSVWSKSPCSERTFKEWLRSKGIVTSDPDDDLLEDQQKTISEHKAYSAEEFKYNGALHDEPIIVQEANYIDKQNDESVLPPIMEEECSWQDTFSYCSNKDNIVKKKKENESSSRVNHNDRKIQEYELSGKKLWAEAQLVAAKYQDAFVSTSDTKVKPIEPVKLKSRKSRSFDKVDKNGSDVLAGKKEVFKQGDASSDCRSVVVFNQKPKDTNPDLTCLSPLSPSAQKEYYRRITRTAQWVESVNNHIRRNSNGDINCYSFDDFNMDTTKSACSSFDVEAQNKMKSYINQSETLHITDSIQSNSDRSDIEMLPSNGKSCNSDHQEVVNYSGTSDIYPFVMDFMANTEVDGNKEKRYEVGEKNKAGENHFDCVPPFNNDDTGSMKMNYKTSNGLKLLEIYLSSDTTSDDLTGSGKESTDYNIGLQSDMNTKEQLDSSRCTGNVDIKEDLKNHIASETVVCSSSSSDVSSITDFVPDMINRIETMLQKTSLDIQSDSAEDESCSLNIPTIPPTSPAYFLNLVNKIDSDRTESFGSYHEPDIITLGSWESFTSKEDIETTNVIKIQLNDSLEPQTPVSNVDKKQDALNRECNEIMNPMEIQNKTPLRRRPPLPPADEIRRQEILEDKRAKLAQDEQNCDTRDESSGTGSSDCPSYSDDLSDKNSEINDDDIFTDGKFYKSENVAAPNDQKRLSSPKYNSESNELVQNDVLEDERNELVQNNFLDDVQSDELFLQNKILDLKAYDVRSDKLVQNHNEVPTITKFTEYGDEPIQDDIIDPIESDEEDVLNKNDISDFIRQEENKISKENNEIASYANDGIEKEATNQTSVKVLLSEKNKSTFYDMAKELGLSDDVMSVESDGSWDSDPSEHDNPATDVYIQRDIADIAVSNNDKNATENILIANANDQDIKSCDRVTEFTDHCDEPIQNDIPEPDKEDALELDTNDIGDFIRQEENKTSKENNQFASFAKAEMEETDLTSIKELLSEKNKSTLYDMTKELGVSDDEMSVESDGSWDSDPSEHDNPTSDIYIQRDIVDIAEKSDFDVKAVSNNDTTVTDNRVIADDKDQDVKSCDNDKNIRDDRHQSKVATVISDINDTVTSKDFIVSRDDALKCTEIHEISRSSSDSSLTRCEDDISLCSVGSWDSDLSEDNKATLDTHVSLPDLNMDVMATKERSTSNYNQVAINSEKYHNDSQMAVPKKEYKLYFDTQPVVPAQNETPLKKKKHVTFSSDVTDDWKHNKTFITETNDNDNETSEESTGSWEMLKPDKSHTGAGGIRNKSNQKLNDVHDDHRSNKANPDQQPIDHSLSDMIEKDSSLSKNSLPNNNRSTSGMKMQTEGTRVLYNGALVINDDGCGDTSDDCSVIDMPESELERWKVSKTKYKQNEYVGHFTPEPVPYDSPVQKTMDCKTRTVAVDGGNTLRQPQKQTLRPPLKIEPLAPQPISHQLKPMPLDSIKPVCNNLQSFQNQSNDTLTGVRILSRGGMLTPLQPITNFHQKDARGGMLAPINSVNQKDPISKTKKKKQENTKKTKDKLKKKPVIKEPIPKPVEVHGNSSTESFSMPSFELGEDFNLRENEISGSQNHNMDKDFIVDSADSSNDLIQRTVNVRHEMKMDDDFRMDSYESSDNSSAGNTNYNCDKKRASQSCTKTVKKYSWDKKFTSTPQSPFSRSNNVGTSFYTRYSDQKEVEFEHKMQSFIECDKVNSFSVVGRSLSSVPGMGGIESSLKSTSTWVPEYRTWEPLCIVDGKIRPNFESSNVIMGNQSCISSMTPPIGARTWGGLRMANGPLCAKFELVSEAKTGHGL